MEINGLRVVITGASRGLGRALAQALSARGARLALVARDAGALDALARALNARGGEAHAVPGDVGDKGSAYPIASTALAALGGVDVLVHNASALGVERLVPLLDTECEDLERSLAVNLVGPHRLTRRLGAVMALHRRGLIVLVSSDAAVEPYPNWGAYGAAKAALDHYGRVLAAELAEAGVTVVSVDPGEMDTDLHAQAMPEADRALLADPRDVAARVADLIATPARSGSRVTVAS